MFCVELWRTLRGVTKPKAPPYDLEAALKHIDEMQAAFTQIEAMLAKNAKKLPLRQRLAVLEMLVTSQQKQLYGIMRENAKHLYITAKRLEMDELAQEHEKHMQELREMIEVVRSAKVIGKA
jgi:Holliday junction resolvasome RuvABC ATP-dependent DNA helicase subunit